MTWKQLLSIAILPLWDMIRYRRKADPFAILLIIVAIHDQMMKANHNKSAKAYEILQKMDNYITFAGKQGLQVHNLNVDKGKGILNLSKKLNIDKSEVMAIGDSHNDLPMREATDKLIAMDNAKSEFKEIADYITKSNDEDGVAHAIEKFCL